MRHHPREAAFAAVLALTLTAPRSDAQTCPCPPKPTPGWHGNAGAGLAVTSGNSDTQTYNLNLLVVYDPQRKHVVTIDGLYLKSKAEGEETANRSAFGVRDDYKLGRRAFLFGEVRFQRDRFKLLESLVTPTIGAGYRLLDDDRVRLAVDAGVGLALEKLEGRDGTTDGALKAGEAFAWKISDNSRLTQAASALWKVDDFADAFYHLEAGLASSINSRLELKTAGIVDVKNKPAAPTILKTDKALLVALVFKF
jgi:putative salt-induced outer membrane protein